MLRGIGVRRPDAHREQNDRRTCITERRRKELDLLSIQTAASLICGGAGVFEARGAAAAWIHREGSREPKYLFVLAVGGVRQSSTGWCRRIWRCSSRRMRAS